MTDPRPDTGSGAHAGTPADARPAPQRDVEELRAEIGDTVEELTHRVDVPARLREKRAETTERVHAQVTQAREVIAEKAPEVQAALRERPALVGGIAAALVYLLLRRLRGRKRRKEDLDGTR
jgi:gas vesicle protein